MKKKPVKKKKVLTKKQKNKLKKKKYIEKKRKEREEYILHYKSLIDEHKNRIWNPPVEPSYDEIYTNSVFTILKYTSDTKRDIHNNIISEFPEEEFKTIRLEMHLYNHQKNILFRWLNAYTKMYNATIHYIKHNECTLNHKTLRTVHLKAIRDKIKQGSQLPNFEDNTKIMIHILDCAIKLACSNYKSALTNLRNGNIRHFRIRYWRTNRPFRIMEIESSFFRDCSICPDILGSVRCTYDGEHFDMNKLDRINKITCTLRYITNEDKFELLVPIKIKPENNNNLKEMLIMDPGIRVFMNGLSEDEVLKIGEEMSDKIKHYLGIIDDVNNNNKIPQKIRKKIINRTNKKISNMVDELHWKVINYLISHYKTILIGDMSVKGITNNQTSVLSKMTKRVGYRLKFYKFRQRLQYKCNINKINYKVIDERFTSKMCSCCGNCKEDLYGSKIYKCDECKMIMDRDVNGCRGIYIKSFDT